MRNAVAIVTAALLCSVASSAFAEDWVAERLRGSVVQWEGGQWVPVQRGDVIPDERKLRTGADGRAEFVRGQERIALAANTEVIIQDAGDRKMTSVLQSFGSVSVEAERRNVQHFSVQTPVLAAVVKGTEFTVTYVDGVGHVSVDRGVVQVQDMIHDVIADVKRGQSAAVSRSEALAVEGPGSASTVFSHAGHAVTADQLGTLMSGARVDASGTKASNGAAATVVTGPAAAVQVSPAAGVSVDVQSSPAGGASAAVSAGSGGAAVTVSTPSATVSAGASSSGVEVSVGGTSVSVGAGGLGLGL